MNRVLFYMLCGISVVGFATAPYLIFFHAPIEPIQGFVQKIFYFHVPCGWAMLLSAFFCGVGSAAYLFAHKQWGDQLGLAASELTILFGTIVLITGPLWAKLANGHYWVWDARLTTVFVLYLIFLGVLVARRFAGPAAKKVAAGLALFGAADVPLIYISVELWNTVHPDLSVVFTLDAKMKVAFFVSLATFTALFFVLLWIRTNLERSKNELDSLYIRIQEKALVTSGPKKNPQIGPGLEI